MQSLSTLAILSNLPQVLEFVDKNLESLGCSASIQLQLDVAVEEIFVNIASYAYGLETGSTVVRFDASPDPACVTITFMDHGVPYDPLAKPDPDIALPLRERNRGGLGIFMAKQYMDDITYQHKDGQNILTLKKRL